MKDLLEFIKHRFIFVVGCAFCYILPFLIVISKLNIVTVEKPEKTISMSLSYAFFGFIYVLFFNSFVKKKLHDLKPGAVKTFLQGLISVFKVSIVVALVQVVQDVMKKVPHLDIAKYGWYCIECVLIGLALQVLDAAINRKYLHDLEISKLAKEQIEIENRKKELMSK